MNVAVKIAVIVIGTFEAFVIMRYICKILKIEFKDEPVKNAAAALILAAYGVVADITGIKALPGCIIAFLCLILLTARHSGKRLYKKIAVPLSAVVTAFGARYAAYELVSSSLMRDYFSVSEIPSIVEIPRKIIEAALTWLAFDMIIKLCDQNKVRFQKRNVIQIITIFVCTILSIALVNHLIRIDSINAAAGLLIEFPIMIAAVTEFYMTLSLGQFHRQSEELKLIKQQSEFQTRFNEGIKRQYDEMRMIRHDLKQVYAVLLALLQENKIDEATEYLNKNQREIDRLETLIDVGNDFVNAILNSKLNLARSLEIEVRCCVDKALSFEAADMCTLLGNMLDNAIEACGKCSADQKYIEIDIASRGEQCLITVLNSTAYDVLNKNSELLTTKPNTELHGFGTRSIRQIAEKYDGNVRYFQEGDMFACEVLLSK